MMFFFFQAEDGIRDKLVTGVQTCALPIYQHLVGVIPQDRLLVAAADQPPTVRPIAAGGDVAATRWGDLVAVASDSGVTFYDPLGRRDPAFVKLTDAPRALAFSPSGHRIYVARRNMPGLAVLDRYERKEA